MRRFGSLAAAARVLTTIGAISLTLLVVSAVVAGTSTYAVVLADQPVAIDPSAAHPAALSQDTKPNGGRPVTTSATAAEPNRAWARWVAVALAAALVLVITVVLARRRRAGHLYDEP